MSIKQCGVIIFAAIAATFVASWIIVSAGGSEQITACVSKTGALHLIGDVYNRNACRKNETFLSWNIKGEKGDNGDTGVKGEKGDKGDPGVDGKDASKLHLFDANGQDFGIVIDGHIKGSSFWVYNKQIDGFFTIFQRANGEAGIDTVDVSVHFEKVNCEGEPFFTGDFPTLSTQVVYYNRAADKFYKKNGGDNFQKRNSLSRLDEDKGCVGDISTINATLLLEDVNLPFTQPFALPLEVG